MKNKLLVCQRLFTIQSLRPLSMIAASLGLFLSSSVSAVTIQIPNNTVDSYADIQDVTSPEQNHTTESFAVANSANLSITAIRSTNYLDTLVLKLRTLKHDRAAEVNYDLMSGALIWTDEIVCDLTPGELGCLRAILRFRTSLITNEPDERFRRLWTKLQVKYPDWFGFGSTRCQAAQDLALIVLKHKASSKKYISKIP